MQKDIYKIIFTITVCLFFLTLSAPAMIASQPVEEAQYLTEETFYIEPNGQEVFTSLPLDPDHHYSLAIKGAIEGVRWSGTYDVDALYYTDDTGSFTRPHHDLIFNTNRYWLISEDRANHAYAFQISGQGKKLSVRLFSKDKPQSYNPNSKIIVYLLQGDPKPVWGDRGNFIIGAAAGVMVLLAGAIIVKVEQKKEKEGWREAEEERRQEERARVLAEQERLAQEERQRKAEEQRQQEEARLKEEEQRRKEEERCQREEQEKIRRAQEDEEERHERMQKLTDLYGAASADMYEDDKWLEDKARKNCREILNQKSRILREFEAFHKDHEFIDSLKKTAPHIYHRATWELRVLRKAERVDAELPQPPPPRKKLTAEEVREKIIRRARVQYDDKIARKEAKIEAIQKGRSKLDQYDLEPDERQALERELIEEILGDDEESGDTRTV